MKPDIRVETPRRPGPSGARPRYVWFVAAVVTLFAASASAQISFTTAIDLALRHSPRVLMAQDDVDRARAALDESHDVFIPSIVAGSGLGYSYGFPIGQPSIYNFNVQSLIFNFSQRDYIRAARLALEAANYALMDARDATAEETVNAYLSLDFDLQRDQAITEQSTDASHLVAIVEERLDAGLDTGIDLTNAKLSNAQIQLALLRDKQGTEYDRAHLARLTGLPGEELTTLPESVPPVETWVKPVLLPGPLNSPGVLAAYSRASSRDRQARGDSHYLYRPQVGFGAQYSRFASFNNYEAYYLHFQHNNASIGVQVSLPLFDIGRRARSRESAADALHALHEADQQRDQFLDGRLRLKHTSAELTLRLEIARLDHQLAQQQLEVTLVQLQQGNGNLLGRQTNPRDEQNARIAAQDRLVTLLNTTLEFQQTEINLLRQTGQLEPWLKSLAAGPSNPKSLQP